MPLVHENNILKKSFSYRSNNSRKFTGILLENNTDLTIWYGTRIVEIKESEFKKLEELQSYKTLVSKKLLIVKDYNGKSEDLKEENQKIKLYEKFKEELGDELTELKEQLTKKDIEDIKKDYASNLTASDKKIKDIDKLIQVIIDKIYKERMEENGYSE